MADQPAKGNLKKLILMGGGGLALAGLLGGGGFFAYKKFFKKAKHAQEAPPPPPDPAAEDREWEKKHPGPPAIMTFDRIVNLESGRKSAFLKCTLNIVFRDPELGKLATGDKPSLEKSQIEALLLDKLSGLTVEEATDKETRTALSSDIKDLLNERFGPQRFENDPDSKTKLKNAAKRPIKEVLVTAWAVQL